MCKLVELAKENDEPFLMAHKFDNEEHMRSAFPDAIYDAGKYWTAEAFIFVMYEEQFGSIS